MNLNDKHLQFDPSTDQKTIDFLKRLSNDVVIDCFFKIFILVEVHKTLM